FLARHRYTRSKFVLRHNGARCTVARRTGRCEGHASRFPSHGIRQRAGWSPELIYISRNIKRLNARLRVRATWAQYHRPDLCVIRKCSAPLASVQALSGSYRFSDPPRLLETVRTAQSYPLNFRGLVGAKVGGPEPFTIATVATRPPGVGVTSKVKGG